ncbi:transcription initiation factor TFIID subunit 4-like [Octodon degus]|uniref:Transcription initiation factor TFIID subunit 4-like n=1 Tax=Octodon degus TaxID=10160 RepID=A0A6P6D835_OCTDE|nr:transcription initiation factor TFIID subunit 4-like [Octodon degus]
MGSSVARAEAGIWSKGRLGGRRWLPGQGMGGLTPGSTLLQPHETGCPRSGKTETTPGVPIRDSGVRAAALAAPKSGGRHRGGGGPVAPLPAASTGVSVRDTPSPGSGRRRHRAVTSPELRRGSLLFAVCRGRGPPRGSAVARREPSSGSGAAQGQTPTPTAAMMDYEPLHNEARPRPLPRPRDVRSPPLGGPGHPRSLFHGMPPHLRTSKSPPEQLDPPRPFLCGFSERKVSCKEAPASPAPLLVAGNPDQAAVPPPIGRGEQQGKSCQPTVFGSAARRTGSCGPRRAGSRLRSASPALLGAGGFSPQPASAFSGRAVRLAESQSEGKLWIGFSKTWSWITSLTLLEKIWPAPRNRLKYWTYEDTESSPRG